MPQLEAARGGLIEEGQATGRNRLDIAKLKRQQVNFPIKHGFQPVGIDKVSFNLIQFTRLTFLKEVCLRMSSHGCTCHSYYQGRERIETSPIA